MRIAPVLLCSSLCFNAYSAEPVGPNSSPSPALHHASAQQDLKQQILSAIHQFEQTDISQWSYQVSRYENEEGTVTSSLERFDPRHGEGKRWTLLRTNGQAPTEKQQQAFAAKKHENEKKNGSVNLTLKLNELIQVDSLQRVSEDEQHLHAQFKVYLNQLGKEASEQLQGYLVYDKAGAFIKHIEIVNTEEFSPMFSASIQDITLSLQFIKRHEAILTKQINLNMQGKFAFFTEINEVSTDAYSDYQYHGSTALGVQ
ncbi:hypothetical protein [Lacimicrobium sp. SS2-24]|uniref:hypothetical protein n=1 Tax=Lacimicrobium sp. SS2-24 TaxID=2005569 RepID=UPI000B4AE491|nr:hypothetical protein [Lacimicrobium sp. SS2-24]